jgi:pimeloyl-ACP methyl ester carboxylesterase
MKRNRWLLAVPLLAGLLAGGAWYAYGPAGGALGAAPSPAGIAGLWQGTLEVGAVPLRIVFKIERKPDGTLTGTLDSPDQGAADIPLSDVSLKDDSVRITVNSVFGVYEGRLAEGGQAIAGKWSQGGTSLPLTMKRVDKVAEVRRPQEPKKPYPYREEEVSYENKKGGSRLAGTLTLPRKGGPFPAALLVTGSGQQDRNETVMGHQPFLVLADYLTRRGIAVLRVDDRGVGGSKGEVAKATSEDFAGDVLAGVAYLQSRKEIDPRKIGLIGHSEGGMIAPMAAVRSNDVAFLVLMAGTGVTGEQILYRQSDLILQAEGGTTEQIAQNRKGQEQIFAVLKRETDDAAAENAIRKVYEKLLVPPVPGPAQAAATAKEDAKKPEDRKPPVPEPMIRMVLSPWFRYFLTYDPQPTLRKVKCPVLAVNGENDLQVPAKENLSAIRAALQAGGNRDVTIKEMPNLNHLFQTSRTGAVSEYARIEETFSPAALKVIGDWIVQRTRK